MRRSINPKVLITSWPPPNENYEEFNRKRFRTWFRYMLLAHDIPKSVFTNTNQKEYICHRTLHAIYYGERDLTRETIGKIVRIFARNTNRDIKSLNHEALANTKPFKSDS